MATSCEGKIYMAVLQEAQPPRQAQAQAQATSPGPGHLARPWEGLKFLETPKLP